MLPAAEIMERYHHASNGASYTMYFEWYDSSFNLIGTDSTVSGLAPEHTTAGFTMIIFARIHYHNNNKQ